MTAAPVEKGERFKALHERAGAFVIPNPWDAGSAKILKSLGFEALTTTSAGLAYHLGRRDGHGEISREETLANAKTIADATDLPVAADLENGFGHTPQACAETIRLAGEFAGIVGGSIEDATGDERKPIYDFQQAVDRIAAAAEAADALPFKFMLVARAENYLYGRRDLDDTLRRLQAFESVGADVLYAPGLTRPEDIRTVCSTLKKPVNALCGAQGGPTSIAELAALGVKRVSVGSALNRTALGAFIEAARELAGAGTFRFIERAPPYTTLNELMHKT